MIALAEVEKRLGVAGRLARCIDDPRRLDQIVHSLADMIGFRMKMIAAGYEDGNDATRLRSDPIFKMAEGTLPSGRDLASQSTIWSPVKSSISAQAWAYFDCRVGCWPLIAVVIAAMIQAQ